MSVATRKALSRRFDIDRRHAARLRRVTRAVAKRAIARPVRFTELVAPLASPIAALFISVWAIDPELLGPAETAIPSLRWALAILMVCSIIGASLRGVRCGLPILLFIFAVSFTIVLNHSAGLSVPIWARVFGAGVFAIFAGSLGMPSRLKLLRGVRRSCLAVVIGSLAYGLAAPGSAFHLIGLDRNRLYGLTSHPAILGYFGALVTCWYLDSAFRTGRRRSLRALDLALAGSGLAVTVLADSRTAQLAIAVTIASMILMARLIRKRLLRRSITLAWVIGSLLTLAALAYPIALATNTLSAPETDRRYELSTMGRISIWSQGIGDFEKSPVTGTGIGTRFWTYESRKLDDELFYFHSALINYLAQSGLIGTVPFIIMLLSAPYALLKCARRSALLYKFRAYSGFNDQLLAFSLTAFVVTITFATTEAALQNLYPSFLIFFLSIVLPNRAPLQRNRPQ